jgi:hypothetical protein
VDGYLARGKETPPTARIKVSQKRGQVELELQHPSPKIAKVYLLEAIRGKDLEFLDGLLNQLCNVSARGQSVNEDTLNFLLSIIKSIEPRDQVEAMLAAQMAATHNAVMTFARRLNNVETIPQQDSAERAFNKLARTFAAQVEALKRYRSRGEQTVRVEHVTVNEGGQAIVGSVLSKGVGGSEKGEPTS